jgi:uncharacterized protein (TIGR02466 family)
MPLATLFSTPVAMYEHPELSSMNQEITAILVAESESIPSVARSNVGGWHSAYNLQTRPEPCFRKLAELIVARAQETSEAVAKTTGGNFPKVKASAHMWAMVMRDGHYTSPHTHSDSHWGTVYYPDAGDANTTAHPGSGVITFVDPRSGNFPIPGLSMTVGEFVVSPQTGQLLVFPGWLMHYVHTYRGSRPRVSISCNVTYEYVP